MLEIGATAEASYVATERDMASALAISEKDQFPEAAARALRPLLQSGQLSVGVTVNIKHLAATPSHTEVSARATYLGMEGKLNKFRVEAFDPGGKIGEGEHTRAIINTERLMQGAHSRLEGKA